MFGPSTAADLIRARYATSMPLLSWQALTGIRWKRSSRTSPVPAKRVLPIHPRQVDSEPQQFQFHGDLISGRFIFGSRSSTPINTGIKWHITRKHWRNTSMAGTSCRTHGDLLSSSALPYPIRSSTLEGFVFIPTYPTGESRGDRRGRTSPCNCRFSTVLIK